MKYAKRTEGMKASAIRELLKITQQPEIISFAGGLPSPQSFPLKRIEKLCRKVLKKYGPRSLQYGPTEGIKELRKELIKRLRKRGIRCKENEIISITGSQQILDIIPKIFINPKDYIAVELPTYLGAISAFNAYQPRYLTVEMDENGMKTHELEKKLKKTRKKVKFIYAVPTFQNPAGVTLSVERRKHLLEIAEKYNIPILEDDAYYDLRYSGKPYRPIKSFDKKKELVIYTSTFSKVLSPGFRLGFVVAREDILRKIVIAKQGMDLCSNMFIQFLAYEYLKSGGIEKQIPKIKRLYKRKRDLMLKALEKHFPEGSTWTKPAGGMFIWATLPKKIDTQKIFKEVVKEKVAYVPGSAFFVNGKGHNTMRLNFSNADDNKIELGIKRLGRIIKKKLH
jgi:2-aminoadipate transaminase